ncbi:MAG: DeoR family transcriptional regulator, partial [Oleiphilaceae bacterium]|nr:DeoR family transcriptional regulator [Oleiphilaceae bacterium]
MAQRHRQDLIMELIQQNGFVTTEQLVDHFNVTPQTIRRDLNQLAQQSRVRRHHGGAGIDSSTVNTSYQTRQILDLEAKERIAEAVARVIPDNASIFINIGTTTETIARALLAHNGLRVVTNNLHVASILAARDDFHIIIAGGEVRNRDGGIVG